MAGKTGGGLCRQAHSPAPPILNNGQAAFPVSDDSGGRCSSCGQGCRDAGGMQAVLHQQVRS
ncbi:uncharacterized protein GLRG_05887 [Colletotrichum graminicola M1.001]|uniref:Uncharacterized protein n=1 Tax=Colletotrichum graminicola (strain M1.001 / M2 / FGSC 10212) TaxID=645133 RepID=E3QIQ5_COLGM|nr:uncharacterized protein GLRG_05887 [Colletotrichum graminicola M1.001]EFQ30743.1 hypothetical protein GLRG_05887 [Colletotrichum graminicola M1.001]